MFNQLYDLMVRTLCRSVDEFVLLKKLYEGSLSVVCQAQHKKSGCLIALKIYKRSRLHEMERFQASRVLGKYNRVLVFHDAAKQRVYMNLGLLPKNRTRIQS